MAPLAATVSWLERTFKTDIRYALRGGFFLTLQQVVSAVAALGLTVAFANLLPVETYGTYRYVLAVYSILAIASLPGLDIAVLQSVARGHDNAFWTGIKTKLRWATLGTLAAFVYAGYQYSQGSLIMGHVFVAVGVALPFMESYSLYTSFLNGKKLFRTWALVDIATQAISMAVFVGAMLLTKNIVLLLVCYFATYILLRVTITHVVWRRYSTPGADDPDVSRYGRSMTLLLVISKLMASADQIALYHFLGAAQVAIYSLALAIPNRIQSLFRTTGTLAMPKFAARSQAEIVTSLPRKMAFFGVGIAATCLVYVAVAPFMFTHVFPRYLPSLPFSQVAVFFTLQAIMYPFSTYLLAHKKLRETYTISIAMFVAKVACLAIFVPRFGIWGAIIGLLATSVVTIAVSLWFIYRDRRSPSSAASSG